MQALMRTGFSSHWIHTVQCSRDSVRISEWTNEEICQVGPAEWGLHPRGAPWWHKWRQDQVNSLSRPGPGVWDGSGWAGPRRGKAGCVLRRGARSWEHAKGKGATKKGHWASLEPGEGLWHHKERPTLSSHSGKGRGKGAGAHEHSGQRDRQTQWEAGSAGSDSSLPPLHPKPFREYFISFCNQTNVNKTFHI
jgi:hypothetical protein